ncbi:hypothetical protein SO802_009902 [Lithocarpus litseifolius]|uniref:Uncharacterized protein n=1 Tax=Lithocarpus litseifolius TaxID=425828 RepID=A0AAW2DCR7_9ROSI
MSSQWDDETGSTTFILFDKGAEKIISETTKELAEMQEEDTMEEIVRKSGKDKYIASQKIEIGATSVGRPKLIAPITTEDRRIECRSAYNVIMFPNLPWTDVNDSAVFVIFGVGRLGFAKFGAKSLAVVDDNSFEYDDIIVY